MLSRALIQQRLSVGLFQSGMVLTKAKSPEGKGFRLKLHQTHPDAPLSPLYINLRLLRSELMVKRAAVLAYQQMLMELYERRPNFFFDRLADLPTAATPLVSSLSDLVDIPQITPRADKKGHGTGATIDGTYTPGMTVAMIDDLITAGNSKIEYVEILRNAGLVVNDVFVLVDRMQGGVEELEQHELQVHAFLTIEQVLDYGFQNGLLHQDDYDEIMNYIQPQGG